MKIEVKFEINQVVFFLLNNKVKTDVIKHIYVNVNKDISIMYHFESSPGLEEHNVFASKEDLLKSL